MCSCYSLSSAAFSYAAGITPGAHILAVSEMISVFVDVSNQP
jgi:hypothetical protein